jgi:hypothetical protein
MTHLSLRPLLPWVWPGGLVLAASAFIAAAGPRLDAVDAGLRAYGWMPFVGAALLAWRFRRSRVVALLGGLSLLWLVPAGGDTGIRWDAGTAVLLALVPLVALVRDRSAFSLLGGEIRDDDTAMIPAVYAGTAVRAVWPSREQAAVHLTKSP